MTAGRIAGEYRITLPVYSIGPQADLVYTEKSISRLLAISQSGVVLVRPDGFVAWHIAAVPVDAKGQLRTALQSILYSQKS